MSLIYIEVDDLLEELIESLVAMGYNKGPLLGEIVVDVVNYLNCNICFTCTWRGMRGLGQYPFIHES